jgi:hypothetical protein
MHDAKLYNYYRTFECEMFPLLGADEVSKKLQPTLEIWWLVKSIVKFCLGEL